MRRGLWIVVAVLVAIVALGALANSGAAPAAASPADAVTACRKHAGPLLKAPSSAQWAGLSESTVRGTDGAFYVRSYVDAANGFGGQVRTPWECNVQFSDPTHYRVTAFGFL